ncbi:Glutathione S-transferase 2 [Vermiconidia calcicola]|uniref:Glutathione S-transferase 2 n=1 Tax=Vermiconidia calcicola TaxID=1690605 RepID=A0ACC3MMM6_9PEZI|nr:Glutathione S-transferase 2 [Vermiconidia calcicola]
MGPPNIVLYTGQSPNGIKISITLEELGLPYTVRTVNMTKNEQKSEWFTETNPNGRIPALTDTFDDGESIRIFESGSIMQYLVNRYDKDYEISFPQGTREYIEMTNWLFFQNAGIGPMQGQANHFVRYAADHIDYAVTRYQTELRRLYDVLDKHLQDKDYLVGNKCTIADIAHWGWITLSRWAGVELSEFPKLKAWEERMLARPAVEKGRHVPDRHHRELLQDPKLMEAFEKRGKAFYRQKEKEAAGTV